MRKNPTKVNIFGDFESRRSSKFFANEILLDNNMTFYLNTRILSGTFFNANKICPDLKVH